MSEFEELNNQIKNLLKQAAPPPVELRKAILELDEWINSETYSDLSLEDREAAQNLIKDLRIKLRQSESSEPVNIQATEYPPSTEPQVYEAADAGGEDRPLEPDLDRKSVV